MIDRPGDGVCNSNAREDLVTFDPVIPVHPAQSDVILRYTLGTKVAVNPLDWVGIFETGCWDIDNPLTCQWAPVESSDGAMARERHVVFPANFIQALKGQTESCQFLYVSGSGHILGASQSFKVMDAGDFQEAGTGTASPVGESRDAHSTNPDANSYVNISPELMSSDDEWELATHEELCKTNSTTSDLSDIEILSTSPSKEAVKMKVSAADNDDDADVFEFANGITTSFVAEDAVSDICNDPLHMTAVAELQSNSQYQSIMGVCEPEPEIVKAKRKLKRQIKISPEDVESNLAINTTTKQNSKVKKLKKCSTASTKASKPTSKKMLNVPAPVIKLHIKKSQIVDSESSSDSEEYSSLLQNCNLRKRKRKNNTGKNKCHPAEHHNILSSESDEEIQQASIKKTKWTRTGLKMEESQTPLCNRLALRQQELFDWKTAEIIDKLNRIVERGQMVGHNQPEKESVNSRKTSNGMKTICERLRPSDESKMQEANTCTLSTTASPDKSKVVSKKRKKVGNSGRCRDAVFCVVSAHDKMHSRKESDANTEFENISPIPQNMKSQQNTMVNSKIARNLDENRKYPVSPLRSEDNSGNVDEKRKYTVIPLIKESFKHPEKTTANSSLTRDYEPIINNSSVTMHNLIFGEEINYTRINNIDKGKIHNESTLRSPANLKAVDDNSEGKTENISISLNYERTNEDISICNKENVELIKKPRNNTKLTRCIGANCSQGDTENARTVRTLLKKTKTNSKTSSNFDNHRKASAALNEHTINESLNTPKQKLLSQRKSSELGETGCRMLKTSNVGGHPCCDEDCGENRTELSGKCPWDISSKETMVSTTLDCCPEKGRKKCPRKVKARRSKESPRKRKQAKTENELAVAPSDDDQIQETHQNASQNITVMKVAENLSPNGAEKQGSNNGETTEGGLTVGGNSAVHDVSDTSCRQKPTFEVNDQRVVLTDRDDLMAVGSSVDGMGSPGHRVRKEKSSPSKIRGSQSKFKAKYKCQGRSSSGLQYLRRGEISQWRKLCRMILVNRRRFKAAHGMAATGDEEYGMLAETENTESSTSGAVPKVTTRAELCPQVQDPSQSLAISRMPSARSMEAKGRQTYASVVKGTKQDSGSLDQKVEANTVIDIPSEKPKSTTRGLAEDLKSEIGLAELEERSKLLCDSCVTNAEGSSRQITHQQQDMKFENSLHLLTVGDELTRDFQSGKFGDLSGSRNLKPQADSEIGTSSEANTCGHTFTASYDINNVILAANTKENENAVTKRVGDKRGAKGNHGTGQKGAQADVEEEGNGAILNWPLPTACTRPSLAKEHPECEPELPLKAKRILTNYIQATVVPPAWLTDQPQGGLTGLETPLDASMSSEFELSSSQAGRTELVDLDTPQRDTELGQPPQSHSDPVTDDQPLTWPLPVLKILSSKFGFGNALGDQADVNQINSYETDQGDDLAHSWSVTPIVLDVPSFAAPIQSQPCIPRTCSLRNNSEIKTATGASAMDHRSELGPPGDRPYRHQNTDLRQRVNALEKQIEELNALLANQQRADTHSRGDADNVTASGSSASGRLKSLKHKLAPSAKPNCGTRNLAKSGAETVSAKPRVRMNRTRIVALENQMTILRETCLNATRSQVKIHVKCKKLHVKIRNGKRGVKSGQAADEPAATVTWTEEQNGTHESPSRMESDGLVQEVHSTVEEIPASTSHLESEAGVRSETYSKVEDCDVEHHFILGESEVCRVQKSPSEMAEDLPRVTTSSEQTGAPGIAYHNPVPDELARVEHHGLHQANTTVGGYGSVIAETRSHEGDQLHIITPRGDGSHVTNAIFSRARDPDLLSDHGEKSLSREWRLDLISESPSRSGNSGLARLPLSDLRSHGSIPETPSRMEISDKNRMTYSEVREYDQIGENHTRMGNLYPVDSHLFFTDEAEATKDTVETFAELSSETPDQLREHEQRLEFRQYTDVGDHHVALEGMGDAPDIISTVQDSPALTHTRPAPSCSHCCFASSSCYAPISKVCFSELTRCSPAPVVTPYKLQNLMSINTSDDNHYHTEAQFVDYHRTVASPFDRRPLAISRPGSAAHAPYLYLNSAERPSEYKNDAEICTSTRQPKISCMHRRAYPSCQHSQMSFSHDPNVFISKKPEENKPTRHSGQWIGSHQCQHNVPMEKDDQELDEDHTSERSSPWMSMTEMPSPKPRCLHSAQNLGNCRLDHKHTLKFMATNSAGSERSYLSENKPCLCHATEIKYGPHASRFQPDFSSGHHTSRERCEDRFHGKRPRLPLRDEGTYSVGVDGGPHTSFMRSNPRKTIDITAQNTNFPLTKSLADKTKWPASIKHTETYSSNFPCSNSLRRFPNPHMSSYQRRIHDSNQYKHVKCTHSDKQTHKELGYDIQQYQSFLRNRQERIPAWDDTNSSCPYMACKDPHVLENDHYLISQIPYADQCSSIFQPYSSQPHSSLSAQYSPYLQSDIIGDHTTVNNTCPTVSSTQNCEDRSPFCHCNWHQADPTVDQLSPKSVTEYLPKHRNYCNCFCFTDDCSQRRQIEGSLHCLQNLK